MKEFKFVTSTFKLASSELNLKSVQGLEMELNHYCLDLERIVSHMHDTDWEINSHSLTLQGNQALLSICLQRDTK
jgi:hypothetical protein